MRPSNIEMFPVIRVLQANLGGGRNAQNLVLQTAREERIDVVVLSELYRPPENNGRWAFDPLKSVAIVATGQYPIQRVWTSDVSGLVAAEVGGITFISCYAPPRLNVNEYECYLEAVELEACSHAKVIIAGDFNAWHEEWGSTRSNERGNLLLNTIEQLGLQVLNRGVTPTFRSYDEIRSSVIDVTFASSSITHDDTWSVSPLYTASDHRYVSYSVMLTASASSGQRTQPQQTGLPPNHQPSQQSNDIPPSRNRLQHAGRRWKTTQFSAEAFIETLRSLRFEQRAVTHETMVAIMLKACDQTMQRASKLHRDPHADMYWWTPELAQLRKDCEAARDRVQRTMDLEERSFASADYRTARSELSRAIRVSKRTQFQELINIAEENEFGTGFQVVMSHLRGNRTPPETERDRLELIVSELFPIRPSFEWPETTDPAETDTSSTSPVTPVNEIELKLIASRMSNRKAPGLDGIPNAAVKTAIMEFPEVFRALYQDCSI